MAIRINKELYNYHQSKFMIATFLKKFKKTSQFNLEKSENDFFNSFPEELFSLLNDHGGSTFENGLYRLHSFRSSLQWSSAIAEYFESYSHKIYPFGFDWMGRQFCLGNLTDKLYMFDPATGEDFELDQKLSLLHNDYFVSKSNDMFAVNLYKEFLSLNNLTGISYDHCVGYKIPLLLQGVDGIENYQLEDIEVYWHFQSQLFHKVKILPPGTKISRVEIEKDKNNLP